MTQLLRFMLSLENSIDEDHKEFSQQEAYLLLDIVRGQATVHCLEQQLVHEKLDENIALGNLYKCRAQESKRRLENAEAELGCICNSIWMSGGLSSDAESVAMRALAMKMGTQPIRSLQAACQVQADVSHRALGWSPPT
ncbi:hypothetical protein F5141DRAFT_1061089 [Pisolithus sp. B1]|nr:hypothetical protein F5141DRAFT_1061089 [Pisolithus sp. B1]